MAYSSGGRSLLSRGPNKRMSIEPLVLQVDRSLFMLASGHGSASLALQAPCARFVFQLAPKAPSPQPSPLKGEGAVKRLPVLPVIRCRLVSYGTPVT